MVKKNTRDLTEGYHVKEGVQEAPQAEWQLPGARSLALTIYI